VRAGLRVTPGRQRRCSTFRVSLLLEQDGMIERARSVPVRVRAGNGGDAPQRSPRSSRMTPRCPALRRPPHGGRRGSRSRHLPAPDAGSQAPQTQGGRPPVVGARECAEHPPDRLAESSSPRL